MAFVHPRRPFRKFTAISMAGLAFCLPAIALSQDGPLPATRRTIWTDPYVLTARIPDSTIFLSGGFDYGNYRGRRLETREFRIGGTPTDWLSIWYGRSDYIIKGRKSGSRFRVDSDSYGLRAILKYPTDEDRSILSLQLEAVRPSTAQVTVPGARAQFAGPKTYNIGLAYEDPSPRLTYGLGYSNSSTSTEVRSSSVNIAVSRDWRAGRRLGFQAQGALVLDTWRDQLGRNRAASIRPAILGTASYRFLPWASIEGALSIFPSGLPFAYGGTTTLGTFLPYEPGSPADGLRRDFVAFGSIRLVAGYRF